MRHASIFRAHRVNIDRHGNQFVLSSDSTLRCTVPVADLGHIEG